VLLRDGEESGIVRCFHLPGTRFPGSALSDLAFHLYSPGVRDDRRGVCTD
jgi:hypothetical protein